jgi:DNA-directed RNA polymerase specialized sigma24 family protein
MNSAKKLDLEEVLQREYPRVYRVALSLCQDRNVGLAVVKKVLARSGVMFDRWETDQDADRWFLRYTVLCSRGQESGREDSLFAMADDPAWKGIILAMRHLPMQQREAYLLHHGEGLELRQLATAMDCSSSAAANHLSAAENALRPIAGDRLAGFAMGLPGVMAGLGPAQESLEVEVSRVIRKRRRRMWIRRWVVWPMKVVLMLGAAWLVWEVWRRLAR